MTTPAIVVALDATEQALAALPVAKRLAELGGATLHIVHVGTEGSRPPNVLENIGLTAGELRGCVLNVRAGEPASEITRTARELGSALVVMCTHTTSSARDKVLGSTALAVLERAPCPIVLVRPEHDHASWGLRRILLAHDGTPTTSAAVPPATRLAASAGAELAVLNVAAPGGPPAEHGSLASPRYLDQPQHEWPAWAGEFLERLGAAGSLESLKVRMFLSHGAPGEEVLRFAAEHASDLIVLAWRGVWERERAATVKTIIRGATCPVMVIPPK